MKMKHITDKPQIVEFDLKENQLQPRFRIRPLDPQKIEEMASAIERSTIFPGTPVEIFLVEDVPYLVDGEHRYAAAVKAGIVTIPARVQRGSAASAARQAILMRLPWNCALSGPAGDKECQNRERAIAMAIREIPFNDNLRCARNPRSYEESISRLVECSIRDVIDHRARIEELKEITNDEATTRKHIEILTENERDLRQQRQLKLSHLADRRKAILDSDAGLAQIAA